MADLTPTDIDYRTDLAVAGALSPGDEVPIWQGTPELFRQTLSGLIAYVAAQADAMVLKGSIDASANPNYPAADAGWSYVISVAGKIGGAGGKDVEAGDLAICIVDGSAAGAEAATGLKWIVVNRNISALLASAVAFTPAGNVAATTVQAAIAEIDGEKVAKSGDTMTGALLVPNGSAAAPAIALGAAGTGLRRDAARARLGVCVDGIEQGYFNRGGKLWLRKRMLYKVSVPVRNYVATSPWLISTSAANNSWRSIVWAGDLGLFVAVASTGTGDRVMTSPDGITFTARTPASDNDWRSVAWSPELGLLCAVASTGTGDRVMTSPDGIAWTARTSAADNVWVGIAWSPELGLFAAVSQTGSANRVMTSPDGLTWTARVNPVSNNFNSVCWSAELGLFCAVSGTGTGNRVMTSPDGITWTARTSAADNAWMSVCWSAELGIFCAVASTGTGNRVMTSDDGVTWTARSSAADNDWTAVCWCPEVGLFMAVGITGTGTRVMTSPNGVVWALRTSAADNSWYAIAFSSDLGLASAVAFSGAGNRAMTSVSANKFPYRS